MLIHSRMLLASTIFVSILCCGCDRGPHVRGSKVTASTYGVDFESSSSMAELIKKFNIVSHEVIELAKKYNVHAKRTSDKILGADNEMIAYDIIVKLASKDNAISGRYKVRLLPGETSVYVNISHEVYIDRSSSRAGSMNMFLHELEAIGD